MRIFYIGTIEFSKNVLNKLIELDSNVVGVATKENSGFHSDFADLSSICKDSGIEYRHVTNINSEETVSWIKSLSPDVIFCFGWSNLIKTELLETAPLGVVGFHPAELPKNRGRHPLIWPIVLGLENSASTFFFMDEGADSGDILSQVTFDIDYDDDAKTLYDKVTNIALEQVEKILPTLRDHSFKRVSQDHTKANYWRKRGEEDGKIDFRMSSRAIYNLVRALYKPYVGAHIEYCGAEYKVWRVRELEFIDKNLECGKVLSVDKGKIIVKTYCGAIEILEHDIKNMPEPGDYL